jgi:hypothetical protein
MEKDLAAMGPDEELPARTLAFRASDADRERAVDVIKAAFAEGRLNHDEYADRVVLALKSRTYADLKGLTSDLPSGPLGALGTLAVPETPNVASSFDWPAALMSGGSVALAAFFGVYFGAPVPLLAAIILGVAASVRSTRHGHRWERTAIWGVSGAMLAILIWFTFV